MLWNTLQQKPTPYSNQSNDSYRKSVECFLHNTNPHRKIFPNKHESNLKLKKSRTRCDIVIMSIAMITMHWYRNLNRLCFQQFWHQTKYVSILFERQILKLLNQNFKIKGTYATLVRDIQPICFPPTIENHCFVETTAEAPRNP